jgi:hypothetical protein
VTTRRTSRPNPARARRPLRAALGALTALALAPGSTAAAPERIFADSFECGFTFGWSATVPASPARLQLTSPPTDLADVAGLIPLGSTDPGPAAGNGHVIPVNHMYLNYLFPANGGANAYEVRALAAGEVVMVSWTHQASGAPADDYGIYVYFGDALTAHYEHVHEISPALQTHFDTYAESWQEVSPGFEILFLGQAGQPPTLAVAAGDLLGSTRDYSSNWDVGMVDACRTALSANPGPRRYPSLVEMVAAAGIALPAAPFPGNKFLNAACFLDSLSPSLRPDWEALLVSTPQSCGRVIWDLPGTLQGTWFNPAVDAWPDESVILRLEKAAFSIVPAALSPETEIQIAIASGDADLSALDPDGSEPQLAFAFHVVFDSTPGALVDPPPSAVGADTTVCYNLAHTGNPLWDRLYLRLDGVTGELAIAYEPLAAAIPQCPAPPFQESIPWSTSYRR